jgi:hypothetical protein
MRVAQFTALVGACCLALAPASPAQSRKPPKGPKDLWATINVCDTPKFPHMMGVRASMPGDAQHTKMYMRFAAQYYDPAKQLWLDVSGYPVSSWVLVGSGQFARRQGGYTFAFDPPKGKSFVLRGVVDFKWAKKDRVVRTAQLTTTAGHAGTAGADPKGFTAATCEIK